MALQKNKIIESGFTGNYWRIIETRYNADLKTLRCSIGLYKDQAARDDGKSYTVLDQRTFSNIDTTDLDLKNPIAKAYDEIIKSVKDSKGAETNYFVDALAV